MLDCSEEGTSQKQADELLSKFEKLSWQGFVGDFIKQHPTGSYYISCYLDYREVDGHAFALIDGDAFNISYENFWKEVRAVWRIR